MRASWDFGRFGNTDHAAGSLCAASFRHGHRESSKRCWGHDAGEDYKLARYEDVSRPISTSSVSLLTVSGCSASVRPRRGRTFEYGVIYAPENSSPSLTRLLARTCHGA